MLVRVAGDSIMMSPPFIVSPEEVEEVSILYCLSPSLSYHSRKKKEKYYVFVAEYCYFLTCVLVFFFFFFLDS